MNQITIDGEQKSSAWRRDEYAERGDYHKILDTSWVYYPIYVRKLAWVERFLREQIPRDWLILDSGCGEGVLVESLTKQGYRVVGVDLNYASQFVHPGDLFHLPYSTGAFDLLLCLDVIEHLNLLTQQAAIKEMSRIIKPDGKAVFALPNLAHLESRWEFFRHGRLSRTARISKHPGDRPIGEYLAMLTRVGFQLVDITGIKMTLPNWARLWLGPKLSERIMYWRGTPASLCFLNILVYQKKDI